MNENVLLNVLKKTADEVFIPVKAKKNCVRVLGAFSVKSTPKERIYWPICIQMGYLETI